MSRTEEAVKILAALGLPRSQQNERSALTLLALAKLGPRASWAKVERPLLRTVDIMEFMRVEYGKDYKPNSRETIRRQTIHQFEQARLVDRNPDDPDRPTNSGKNAYRLTEEVAEVLKAFGTAGFDKAVAAFIEQFGTLKPRMSGPGHLIKSRSGRLTARPSIFRLASITRSRSPLSKTSDPALHQARSCFMWAIPPRSK